MTGNKQEGADKGDSGSGKERERVLIRELGEGRNRPAYRAALGVVLGLGIGGKLGGCG